MTKIKLEISHAMLHNQKISESGMALSYLAPPMLNHLIYIYYRC